MTNPIKGMVAVISNYGVGKTTLALECGYHPKEIVFINDDVKEVGFENQFKEYVDLVAISKKKKLLDLHAYCLDMIKRLPKSKVIIWDTWTQFQSTFPVYVKAHLNEFRNPNEWSAMGKMKAGEVYQEAYRYEGAVLSELKLKCDLLILTFHLKQDYLNNVAIPGKFKPGHDRAIEKYADLRIWLTPNPDSQVPVGLVLKNISKRIITEQGIQTSQVLPLKLSRCNWTHIWHYWNEPLGDRQPEEYERPNSFELSLIEGTLTPEDKRLYEASLSMVEKQEAKEQAEQLILRQSQERVIKEYIAANLNGAPGPVKRDGIMAAIEAGKLVYDGEITISKINDWS
jgi:hypothetical protein